MKPTAAATRTLTLAGCDRWMVFRYAPGCEGQVIEHVWRLAQEGRAGLDWLTAATLCFLVASFAATDGRASTGPVRQGRRKATPPGATNRD